MDASYIPAPLIKPATRRICQPVRIFCPYYICHLLRLKLSPSFIKNNPCNNGWMIIKQSNRLLHLFFKLSLPGRILTSHQMNPGIFCPDMHSLHGCRHIRYIPALIIPSSVHHILPDQHTDTVAVIIPSLRFYLNMLTDHIEPQVLHLLDIIDHRFITRRCV